MSLSEIILIFFTFEDFAKANVLSVDKLSMMTNSKFVMLWLSIEANAVAIVSSELKVGIRMDILVALRFFKG